MSNVCKYKVKVKGKKNACYAFLGSMAYMDFRDIDKEEGTEADFTLWFSGDCKEDVNESCQPWEGEFPVELSGNYETALNEAKDNYSYRTVQERSAMFDVEVWCNSCIIDDEPEVAIFEHYLKGGAASGELPEELSIEGTSRVEVRKGEESDLDDLLSKLENMLKFLENPNE